LNCCILRSLLAIHTAKQELVEKVRVALGPNTVLRSVLKNNRFVIEW